MGSSELYTPTCYQSSPIGKVPFKVWASPSFSHDSRDLWASHHVRILFAVHEDFPPTHFVTVKFQRPESVEKLKRFTGILADAAGYYNKTTGRNIAGRWVLEIEADNSCHLHILVRSSLDPESPTYFDDDHSPNDWLLKKIGKANAKLGTIAILDYCKPISTVEGSSKYVYKLGNNDILLFARHLKLRQTGQFGKYFLGKKQPDLKEEYWSAHQFRRIESEAIKICDGSGCEISM